MRQAHDRLLMRFFSHLMGLSLVIIVALTIFFGSQLVDALSDTAMQQARQRISRVENHFAEFIENEIAELVSYHDVFAGASLDLLVRLVSANPRYLDSLILDENGIVQHASNPLQQGYRYGDRSFFRLAREQGTAVFSPRYDALSGELIIDLIVPFRNTADERDYIAVHMLSPRWFARSMESQITQHDGELFLFDDSGAVYLHLQSTGSEGFANPIRPASLFDLEFSLERLESAGQAFQSYEFDRSLVVYHQMEDPRLGFIANRISLAPIDAEIEDVVRIAALAALAAIVLSGLLGMLLARRILKPVTDLSEQVRRTLGGYQDELSDPRHEELEPLVHAFNQAWVQNREHQSSLAEQKRLAEQANAAKSQFLANMSHEIRTPLNGILGLTHLARDGSDPREMANACERIEYSARNLLNIINDILDYSKIEAGALTIEATAFSLSQVLERTAALFAQQIETKSLGFELNVADDVPQYLSGDAFRLGQILTNLVGNAIKFTDSGLVTIEVSCEHRTDSTADVLFEVRDTGIGIDAATQEKLFSAFTQADGSISRRFGGTGLGLAITRQLTTLMNGEIWIESAPGEGTQCFVRLPFGVADEVATEDVAVHDTSEMNLTGKRFLVVEDNQINQEIARELLRRKGGVVTVAGNGAEALERIEAASVNTPGCPYDLIFMDVQMPVMDGYAATKAIRNSSTPAIRDIPIIAMTAHAMAEDRDSCLTAGMNDYLSKPFFPPDFYSIIGTWVGTGADTHEPAPEQVGAPAVDFQRGLSMALDNRALYRQLLQLFVSDGPALLADHDLNTDSPDTVRQAVHSLKGMAGGISARPLADACAELEEKLRNGTATNQDLAHARHETARVLRDIESYLQSP